MDALAPQNKLTFKCSVICPAYFDCEFVATQVRVIWYSNSNQIFNNSLSYNSNEKHWYSFLNESIWTNYVNTNVRLVFFLSNIKIFLKNLNTVEKIFIINFTQKGKTTDLKDHFSFNCFTLV